MSKIICDICGTSYQDTAECCPICGCTRDSAAELLAEDLLAAEALEGAVAKSGKFTPRKKEIFDFDEANGDLAEDVAEEDADFDDEEEENEEEPRHNVFVVILLTILIVALLAAAGFIFVRYFLPNLRGDDTAPSTEAAQTEAVVPESTELVIPCQTLALTSGTAELTQEGQYFLLHVIVSPEDTTDTLVFTSGDESIATVSADGKITAVSEGETVIYITCGNTQMTCPVVVRYEEETLPPTEETTGEEAEGSESDETTAEDGETDETAAVEETESNEGLKDVTLKLKKTDITLGAYLSFQLELDCDLEPTEVEWSSEHPHIVKVDEEGNVTALKSGVTDIIVKYGNQQVVCKVRVP